jgi:hypothetical protein
VLARRHRELARRRRPLAFPFGQEEVGEGLVAADEDLGLRQHEVAKRLEVGLLLVLVDPREVGKIGDERNVGIVGEDLGDCADAFGRAEKADLPCRDRDVLEHAPRLLDDDVGVDRVVVEHLGGVAHDDAGDDRQRVRAHRSDRRDVAGRAAGAARIIDVEAHHARRRGLLFQIAGIGVDRLGNVGHGIVERREGGRSQGLLGPLGEREQCCVCPYTALLLRKGPCLQSLGIVVKAPPRT